RSCSMITRRADARSWPAGPVVYASEVRARSNLVRFDARAPHGAPLASAPGADKQRRPQFLPFNFPSSPAEEQECMRAGAFLELRQRSGRIADHMATTDVALDLDGGRRRDAEASRRLVRDVPIHRSAAPVKSLFRLLVVLWSGSALAANA